MKTTEFGGNGSGVKESGRRTVVIVDDEEDISMYLGAALDDGGFAPLLASSAAEGLALIRRELPALVCLDILMPGESGLSLYRKMRADAELREIPVIITSGLSLSRDLNQVDFLCLPDGSRIPAPDAVIEKPFEPEQLLDTVRRLVG